MGVSRSKALTPLKTRAETCAIQGGLCTPIAVRGQELISIEIRAQRGFIILWM